MPPEEEIIRTERLRSRLFGIMEGFDAGASVDVKQQEDRIAELEKALADLISAVELHGAIGMEFFEARNAALAVLKERNAP